MKTQTINIRKIKYKELLSITLLAALFILMISIVSGCSDDSSITGGNGNNTSDNMTVSVKSDEGVFDMPANVVITEAKALITEVELETEPSGTSHHIRISPFVVYFNMNGALVSFTSGNIPAGNFNKIKFKIHKPEDNETPPDPEFKEGTSGNQRFSFIIKGTYNGSSFVYKSRKSANLVINLSSPINFQNTQLNITVLVNPLVWFNNGTIDPRNPDNDDAIDDNIKNSFKRAFRDDNKDGLPDSN